MDPSRRTCPILYALSALLILSGCQLQATLDSNSPVYTSIPDSPAAASDELKRKDSFTAALDKVNYQELDTEKNAYLIIDTASQAIPFKTGKSYVKGIVLPDDLASATLKIEAIADKTVFVPTLLILKQNFRPSRVIDSSAFSYQPSGILNPDRLQATFEINRAKGSDTAAEKYILIFTTDKDRKGATELQSQADQYARARGLAKPRLPSPVARHAATGLLKISALDVKTMAAPDTTWQDISGETEAGQIIETPVADSGSISPARSAPPEIAVPSRGTATEPSAMFPETEDMYNRLIQKSIDEGDIDKAWRLVQEGEKAGSVTVRRTFMRALDKMK